MSAITEPGEAGGEGRQFVTFRIGDDLFGVPLGEVQEIIRMPVLVQVPLAPPSLEGVANLRGAVLPITNLRRVFGVEELPHDDATRVVVLRLQDRATGIVVDRMASVVTADAAEIEEAGSFDGTVQGGLLDGVVKRQDGMIQLLAPSRLLGEGTARVHAGTARATVAEAPAEVAAVQDDIQLVRFVAAEQDYAFPIADVQEIVHLPPAITRVPQAPPAVLGVITLRERLLPLVSFRRLLGLPAADASESARIIVVASPDGMAGHIGLVVDRVREVVRVPRGLVDPVPALLADGAEGRLEAICRLDEGQRLAAILSAERLFRDAALRSALALARKPSEGDEVVDGKTAEVAAMAEEQFVVFRLAGQDYGISTEVVQEIVRVPEELTQIPRAPSFIEGIVNLRGTVLPVIDQRRRFGLSDQPRSDRQRIMVLQLGASRTGFIVDQVTEVLKLPLSAIEPAPALSAEQARLIRRVANLAAQNRMVLLLDPSSLLDAREVAALAQV